MIHDENIIREAVRRAKLAFGLGGGGGGGASTPRASSTVTGTVKTDVTEADPLVYTKASVDALIAGIVDHIAVPVVDSGVAGEFVFDEDGDIVMDILEYTL